MNERVGMMALAAALLVVGCASGPRQSETAALEGPRGTSYLKEGPTVAVDVAAQHPEPTTLKLLEQQKHQIQQLQDEVLAARSAIRAAEQRALMAERGAGEKSAEVERLQKMLDQTLGDQKNLSEELLSTRIRELRLEQQLLRSKLADLTKDDQR